MCHDVASVPKLQLFSLGGLHLVGLNWKEALQLVVRILWSKINDWRPPNRLLVVQTGDSASQAKVFKAHAVPQGVCVCEKLDQCTQTVGKPAERWR